MTAEHIAVNALREIAKHHDPSNHPKTIDCALIAKKAIEQIDLLQSSSTVHHLDALSLDITDSPGGGL